MPQPATRLYRLTLTAHDGTTSRIELTAPSASAKARFQAECDRGSVWFGRLTRRNANGVLVHVAAFECERREPIVLTGLPTRHQPGA